MISLTNEECFALAGLVALFALSDPIWSYIFFSLALLPLVKQALVVLAVFLLHVSPTLRRLILGN